MQLGVCVRDLPTRDVVALAIDRELKERGETHVVLDVSALPAEARDRMTLALVTALYFLADKTALPPPLEYVRRDARHRASVSGVLQALAASRSASRLLLAGQRR